VNCTTQVLLDLLPALRKDSKALRAPTSADLRARRTRTSAEKVGLRDSKDLSSRTLNKDLRALTSVDLNRDLREIATETPPLDPQAPLTPAPTPPLLALNSADLKAPTSADLRAPRTRISAEKVGLRDSKDLSRTLNRDLRVPTSVDLNKALSNKILGI